MKITIRLRPDRDDDIKEWYQSLPRGDRSRFIRDVLKNFINHKKGNGQDQSFDRGNNIVEVKNVKLGLKKEGLASDSDVSIDSKLDDLLDHI